MVVVGNVPIPYDESNPLNGSFAYLQKITNIEDIVFNKIVKVTVSSIENSNLAIPIIEKNESNVFWLSQPKESNFYEVDFVDNFFYLESFVIRVRGPDFFRNWRILGSDDGINYETLYNATNYQKPSDDYENFHFDCTKKAAKRIFRYETFGNRFDGDTRTYLHRLQFYGRFVFPIKRKFYTKETNFNFLSSTLFLIFILTKAAKRTI